MGVPAGGLRRQQIVQLDRGVGKRQRRNRFAAAHARLRAVGTPIGIPEDEQFIPREVEQPVFGDAVASIGGALRQVAPLAVRARLA